MERYASLDESGAAIDPFSPRTAARMNAVSNEVEDLMLQAAQKRGGGASLPPPVANVDIDPDTRTLKDDLKDWYESMKVEFRFRPKFLLAEVGTFLSILVVLVGLAAEWAHISTGDDGGSRLEGGVHLLFLRFCRLADGGRSATINAKLCTTIDLADIATNADYLRASGGVSFAFLVVALPCLTVAWAVIRGRRKESIDDSWLLQRFKPLRTQTGASFIFWLCSIVLLIAWGSYNHMLTNNFDGPGLGAILFRQDVVQPAPGFGVVIIAMAWTVISAVAMLVTLYPEEPRSLRDIRLPNIRSDMSGLDMGSTAGQGTVTATSEGGIFTGTDTSAAAYFGGSPTKSAFAATGSPGPSARGVDAFAGIAADPGAGLLHGVPSTPAEETGPAVVTEM